MGEGMAPMTVTTVDLDRHWPPRVLGRNPRLHYLLPFSGEWACECGERVRANPDLWGVTYQHGLNREASMTTKGHDFTEKIEQELVEWVVRIHEYTGSER